MWTNRALMHITTYLNFVWIPIQLILNFLLNLMFSIPGIALVTLLSVSLIWIILFFIPILTLSWVYKNIPLLDILAVIIGVPLAIIGGMFVSFIPAMGEIESRWDKMLLLQFFPFSYDWFDGNMTKEILVIINNSYFDEPLSTYAKYKSLIKTKES